ncbi:HEPN domain protein [Pseudonocardia dioxanivorans CB1190]|jgi:uncharacterized protein (UPF0332 family)|uniref:HEPN domain protein n=2 Tax=Pseudonocardia TaxID=1847 RepID=F4CXU9_PSEUX|nr:HEPN domain protein [Pseudonocardia dioxanivorans CB1190]
MQRAHEEIDAATLLLDNGFTTQALSRAFHAAYHAAETALLVLGETRGDYSDVVSAFVRRVVRERALDPEAGRLLRALFNQTLLADHGYEPVPADEATRAVANACTVVAEVEKWLADPGRSAARRGEATRLPAKPPRRRPH